MKTLSIVVLILSIVLGILVIIGAPTAIQEIGGLLYIVAGASISCAINLIRKD